jgi:hypothetical protein
MIDLSAEVCGVVVKRYPVGKALELADVVIGTSR